MPINFVRMVKLYINSCCTCIFTLGSILQSHVASSWTWSCWFLYFRIMLTQTTRMDQYRVLGAEDGSCEAHAVMCVDCVALFLWKAFTEVSSFCTFEKYLHVFIWLCWVLVAAHGTFDLHCGMWISVSSIHTLSCGMWDPVPRPGIKPRSLCLGSTES